MAVTTLTVAPGDDLYRLAAEYYGDASAWTLIAAANPAVNGDPLIQTDMTIGIPLYNATRANDGVFTVPVPAPST
jgi:nucleoid-associated protein YgaU